MISREIRPLLLDWYDENRRDLPWRTPEGELPDPYRVWLSEVMLQQTRVEAVRGYYERWLEQFPTLQALAAAPQDDVMKAWEGLGYYARARNLHRAVREVVERYGGSVPDGVESFGGLPGVGRYTRGAVLSIAFNQQEPVVDGNVRRVFARLTDDPAPPEARLWEMAEELVIGDRPGDLNQALMELGATICTPRSPGCGACPVQRYCRAFAEGTQAIRPLPRKARDIPHEHTGTAVVRSGDSVLLVRRPEEGRLGGMWEFPGRLQGETESAADAAARAAREAAGVDVVEERPLCSIDHLFTHVRVTYHAMLFSPVEERAPILHEQARWVPVLELDSFALPRAQQRIAAMLLADIE